MTEYIQLLCTEYSVLVTASTRVESTTGVAVTVIWYFVGSNKREMCSRQFAYKVPCLVSRSFGIVLLFRHHQPFTLKKYKMWFFQCPVQSTILGEYIVVLSTDDPPEPLPGTMIDDHHGLFSTTSPSTSKIRSWIFSSPFQLGFILVKGQCEKSQVLP